MHAHFTQENGNYMGFGHPLNYSCTTAVHILKLNQLL